MKPFAERNLFVIGAIGLAVTVAIVLGALQLRQAAVLQPGQGVLGLLRRGRRPDERCRTCRFRASQVGKVESIELDGPRVLVKFTVDKNIRLGDRTEAAIKTKGLLGTKILEVTSRGDGQQEGTIPLDRTTSPYQLPDALGDLATTISGLNTDQLSDSLRVLVGDVRRHPARAEDRGRGRGPVLRHAQRARRAAARTADQRQQGDDGAGRAQRPGGQPDRQHQCAAGRAAKAKAPRWIRSRATSRRSASSCRASSPRTATR